jgi:hypothetical protein
MQHSPIKTGELYELEAKNRYLEYLLVNKNNKNLARMNLERHKQLVHQEYAKKIEDRINQYAQKFKNLDLIAPIEAPNLRISLSMIQLL